MHNTDRVLASYGMVSSLKFAVCVSMVFAFTIGCVDPKQSSSNEADAQPAGEPGSSFSEQSNPKAEYNDGKEPSREQGADSTSLVKSTRGVVEGPIPDADEAKKRFLRCMTELFPDFDETPWTAFLDDKTSQPEKFYAETVEPIDAFARIDDTLTERERQQLIIHGSLDSLKHHNGKCWAVRSIGGFGNELAGYLDQNTGKAILIWIVPEG